MTKYQLKSAAIILPAILFISACNEDLYTGLSQREANEMMAVLDQAHISSNRVFAKDKTATIQVDKGSFSKATEALSAKGYPREKYASLADVFNDKGIVKTPLAERARLVYAIEQELAQTLSELGPISGARVHVVLPDTDPLKQNAPLSSASVVVRYRHGADIGILGPQIRHLVAASIEGLTYDRVAVTMFEEEGISTQKGESATFATPKNSVNNAVVNSTATSPSNNVVNAITNTVAGDKKPK